VSSNFLQTRSHPQTVVSTTGMPRDGSSTAEPAVVPASTSSSNLPNASHNHIAAPPPAPTSMQPEHPGVYPGVQQQRLPVGSATQHGPSLLMPQSHKGEKAKAGLEVASTAPAKVWSYSMSVVQGPRSFTFVPCVKIDLYICMAKF